MAMKTVIVALILVFVAGVMVMTFTDKALAAGDGMDRNMEKKGLDALASKKFKTASWPQIWVGVGSLFVAYAVVKWL
jgi:hypothetical protein